MVTQVQFRRGTTAQHASFTGANGEITIDTDKETVVVHDGTTAGGFPLQTTAGLSGNVATLTSNNTSFVGSVSAANVVSNAQLSANLGNYQTTAGLNANIASYLPTYTGVVNGSSHTVGSSFIANATGVYHTGTINAASYTVGSSFIANSTMLTLAAGVGLQANGGLGTAGHVLHSNGTSIYWAPDDNSGTVTSVATGNGLTGGTITTTGTLSVLANTGLVANATGVHVNSSVMFTQGGQTITGGFSLTPFNLGTGSATVTPAPTNGNYQYITNNGAFTLAAPASDCAIDILVTNGASAGSITLSGFTAPSGGGGDTYATTNANRYLLLIRRINSISTYVWKALQ